MSFDFINPAMLLGLLGLSLPVLAHLLSKKKYDVVQWGAMQFLELGRNTRRKIRLEQLLLMLLRMGLIALVVFVMSRPWVSGGWLSKYISTQSRDVVFVIDGSYSMGWSGKATTPHAAARQWAHAFLDDLNSGDTVTLIDARDQLRMVIESPTRDFRYVREQIDALPPPSGTANLAQAATKALQLLSRTSNLARDVIVLTDGQAKGWAADDENLWLSIEELRSEPTVKPNIWVVDVDGEQTGERPNFAVDRLKLSRELTVPGFPVRIKTKVTYTGGTSAISRRVTLEIDGQKLNDKTLSVRLEPNGEAPVEFEHRLTTNGSHLVSVVLEDDHLEGDNRADAALSVVDALPVLLVDGDPHLDPTRSESFFAKAAFSATGNDTPWIQATIVATEKFATGELEKYAAVFLANVPKLTAAQTAALEAYAAAGGGVCLALGDKIDLAAWNRDLLRDGTGLAPVKLESKADDSGLDQRGVRVENGSLELPWVTRFKTENDGGLTEVRFGSWYKVTLASSDQKNADESPFKFPPGGTVPKPAEEPAALRLSSPLIAARLTTGDPWLITRSYGRGGVVCMTSALDADWSTLPAKPDYVSLLHEIVFFLASQRSARNVDVGMPLVLNVPPEFPFAEYAFFGPGKTRLPGIAGGDEIRPLVQLLDTQLPGVYRYQRQTKQGEAIQNAPAETFVVNFDRSESDLTPLDKPAIAALQKEGRMTFVADRNELRESMFTDSSQSELWHLLLFLFLAILIGEVVMTRRLVQGGHAVIDDDEVPEEDPAPHEPAAAASPRSRHFSRPATDRLSDSGGQPPPRVRNRE